MELSESCATNIYHKYTSQEALYPYSGGNKYTQREKRYLVEGRDNLT